MKFSPTSLFFSETERRIRANDAEYNASFKYAVSLHNYYDLHQVYNVLCN